MDTISSHGLGLIQTLQLGRALDLLPPQLDLFLIAIDPARTRDPDADLSDPVAAAVAPLAETICRLVEASTWRLAYPPEKVAATEWARRC